MAKTKTSRQGKKSSNAYNSRHFPCSYCDKTFSDERGRDSHMLLHSSHKPFKCVQCSNTYKTKKYLARHVKAVHNPPTKFQCKYCDKKFHYKSKMEEHIVVHMNSKPHKCKVCGKGFNSQYTLSGHVLIHQNLKPFQCQYCDYACRDSSTLRRHHERHMGIVKQYDCDSCHKTFTRKSSMLEHVAEVHMKVDLKTVPCGQCEKKFKSRTLLNVHIKTIHNRQWATACEICGHRLTNKYNMAAHLLTHVDARPYRCTFGSCTKRYKDKSSLKKHSLIHYPEKQFPCKTCGKRFTRVLRLKQHESQHGVRKVRIRRVQCDYCELVFNNKSSLILHMGKKHPRGKHRLFICDMCDFRTTNKPSIIGHIKGHYRKTFKQCYICQRTYKDERWYKQHLLQAHDTVECNGTPTLDVVVKTEPLDVDALPEFELFEVEKEELLEELNSINNEASREIIDAIEQNVTSLETIYKNIENPEDITESNAKETELLNDNTIKDLKIDSQSDIAIGLKRPEQSKAIEKDNTIEIHNETTNLALTLRDNIARNKENSSIVDNRIREKEDEEPSEKRREEKRGEKRDKNIVTPKNSDVSHTLDSSDGRNRKRNAVLSMESVIEDSIKKKKANLNRQTESLEKEKQNNSIINKDINDLNTTSNNKDDSVKKDKYKNSKIIPNVKSKKNSNNDVSLINEHSNIKSAVSDEDIHGQTKKRPRGRPPKNLSKNNSININNSDKTNYKDTDNKNKGTDNKNRRTDDKNQDTYDKNKDTDDKNKNTNDNSRYADHKRKDTDNKNKLNENAMPIQDIDSQNSEEFLAEDELNEDIEYSRAILSEDLTRAKQKQKRNRCQNNDFDNFVIKNMFTRNTGCDDRNRREELDKQCQAKAREYLDKLLREARERREVMKIEQTRIEYNERVLKARSLRKEKVSIKYFDKSNKNYSNVAHIDDTENEIDISLNNEVNISNTNNSKHKNSNNQSNDNIVDSVNENANSSNTNPSTERDDNIDVDGGKEKAISTIINKERDDQEPNQERDSNTDSEGVSETDRLCLRSSRRKRMDTEDLMTNEVNNVEGSGKMKINSHQCYVCFKLFDTKDKLLDHCKDHFDICHPTILKKCPLCDYATKSDIVHHVKTEHNIQITIPNKRIREKDYLDNGSKYCYNVNSSEIKNIDIIPSVKHLNRQAYIDLDEKNRKIKDTGIAKTKLIKRGNQWIVERKTTTIDNVDDLILPQFEVDEIMSIKIDSTDYLGRLQKLSRLAKMYNKKMVFPCESCEKICQSFCALKLHVRRHDDNKKPFRKKVWKHKLNEIVVPKDGVTGVNKKYRRVKEIDRTDNKTAENRYKKPKPVVSKHKCDPKLIKFYETNVKGGDIEFWQFLKIFNKMSRENVNNFEDLVNRPEFGIHVTPGTSASENNETLVNKNNSSINDNIETLVNINDGSKDIDAKEKYVGKEIRKNVRRIENNRFNRVIRISKRDYKRRNELKQQLRERIAKNL